MRTRELVITALVGAVFFTAAGVASVTGAEDGAAPVAFVPPPTSTSTSTVAPTTTSTSTTTSTTTTTAPAPEPEAGPAPAESTSPLPTPAQPPADPREDVAVVEIGRIKIPKIGLDHAVYEGVSLTVIDVGPGHWPGTPVPGGYGNSVFGGHRVTNSHPFRDVDQLALGDEIVFELTDGTRPVYAVTEQFVVDPDAMWIVDQVDASIVTLFSCHPKGSARQRIVIRAALVAPPG
ncbi:MAG: sortase [Actinomycetota bacterium]